MSRARALPGGDRRTHHGDIVVAELRASGLPPGPRQFEFWSAFKSGRNPRLTAAANAITAHQGALTARDIERLHEDHLSPWRLAEQPERVIGRVEEKLRQAANTIEGAIGSARLQRDVLIAQSKHLADAGIPSPQDLRTTIALLAQATEEAQSLLGALESTMASTAQEIEALRGQLSAVRAEAHADPVTALPARSAFDAALANALQAAAGTRKPVSVLLCDLDCFAAFNENFGTPKGDEVLRSIGMLLKAQARPGYIVARYGADEYAAILPQLRACDAVALAEQFRQTLMAKTFVTHVNGAGRITTSIGIADAIKGDTPDFLMRRAANGLKVAKREGGNRVVEMSPDGPIWDAERRM